MNCLRKREDLGKGLPRRRMAPGVVVILTIVVVLLDDLVQVVAVVLPQVSRTK